MNEEQLRALVREEIDAVLDEEQKIDSHLKFRRLVENKLGVRFENTEEDWDITYGAWAALVQECGDPDAIDNESLAYYVEDAAKTIIGG